MNFLYNIGNFLQIDTTCVISSVNSFLFPVKSLKLELRLSYTKISNHPENVSILHVLIIHVL